MPESTHKYFSKTLEKGLQILSLFNESRPSLTQTEISRITGINMTSTYRLINTLVVLGYLRRDDDSKRIKVGTKAILLGNDCLKAADFLQIVKPMVDDFHRAHNVTVDVALVEADSLLIVYRKEAAQTLIYRLPTIHSELNSTSLGKAYLAFLPDDDMRCTINRIVLERKTPNTIVSQKVLIRELEETRCRGYARSNEEYVKGLITLGAPLINVDTNRAVGSISFDFSSASESLASIEKKYADKLVKLAKDLSELIPAISD